MNILLIKKAFLFVIVSFVLSGTVLAQKIPVLDFFHGRECPHCHEEKKWFPELKEMYPNLQLNEYEVWHDTANQKLWAEKLAAIGMQPQGVPTNIINGEVVVGFNSEGILSLLEKNYGPPVVQKEKKPEVDKAEKDGWKKYLSWSWPLMSFALGLVDGFNPCAMWSLLVLISFLLTIESKKKRWFIGGVFLFTSGGIYMFALLAYLFGFSQISVIVASGVMMWIFRVVGLLAIITGLMAIRSGYLAANDCKVEDMGSRKKFGQKLEAIMNQKSFWIVLLGVIGLAISVNAIELLCSFAIPTAFTAALVSGGFSLPQQLSAILIYDFAYMLDDLIVFTIAMWTLNLKMISGKLVQYAQIVGGVLLFIVGASLALNPELLSTIFN